MPSPQLTKRLQDARKTEEYMRGLVTNCRDPECELRPALMRRHREVRLQSDEVMDAVWLEMNIPPPLRRV